jgi:hypothetical protein
MSADRIGGDREPASGTAISGGEWFMPAVSYVDPRRRFCQFCGRPIARRFWQAETKRGVGIFCNPAHAALEATYPKSPASNTNEEDPT